ncbi:uncharacterized protein FTOL_06245 [Fusarium torulosum]|uniref:Uncharacterized protein n=1 Tax=Fusarium torulosum TaxID=33205 RepID=A0AAE8SI89_9HYPO|nr:uncharacterized protein FTOL_06245 [Fusarium torulosum]
MAALVPFPQSGLSATYSPWSNTLLVKAQGEVPGYLAGAFIKREDWVGGLRFSLRAFPLIFPENFPPPGPKKIDATLKVQIHLPLSWLNSKTVLFETAGAEYNVNIEYLLEGVGPVDSPKKSPSSNDEAGGQDHGGRIIGSVLTPIKVLLGAGGSYRISARVPIPESAALAPLPSVKISFNSEFIKLVDSSHVGDSIVWDVAWEKLPTGEGQNPQSVDVTTSIPHTEFGGLTNWTRIIQPYTVEFIVYEQK